MTPSARQAVDLERAATMLRAIAQGTHDQWHKGSTALVHRLEGAATALLVALATSQRNQNDRLRYTECVKETEGQVAVGYIRVSTQEQADSGAGLAAQRRAIEVEAARRGWELSAIHEDGGLSGKATAGRPGLAKALSEVSALPAGVLVVSKVDRLSRSLIDFANVMAQAEREGWRLVALDLGVDTTTPTGEMVATITAAASQYERRLIGARTREALAIKRSEGVRLGRPPSVSAEVRQAIAADRAAGMSWRAIAERLTARGVATGHGGAWHANTCRRIFLADVREH